MAIEYADEGRGSRVFEGLALGSGFSKRDCVLAARAGLLGGIVKAYELRSGRRGQAGVAGCRGRWRWPACRRGRAGCRSSSCGRLGCCSPGGGLAPPPATECQHPR
jgi:hypothetical protein